jgi:hypothetical protein
MPADLAQSNAEWKEVVERLILLLTGERQAPDERK